MREAKSIMVKTSSMVHKTLAFGAIILICCIAVSPSFNAHNVSMTKPVNERYLYFLPDIGQEIVWDNGMNYDGLYASQRDESYPFEAIVADDFQFENETIINDIHWIGGYWANGPYNFDMLIIFYYDRGDGNAPGDIYAGPYYFLNSDVNQTYIGPYYCCDYYTTLPEPVVFIENQRFWISIQGFGFVPPQWGIGGHHGYKLHDCVFKCELLGFPEWTSSRICFGAYIDVSFRFIHRENNPPEAPVIDGPGRWPAGKEVCFTFHSTDPDGDNVMYLIDWGDGTYSEWLGPFPQCEPVEVCHTYKRGNWSIRAKVRDINGYESEWSEPFQIEIPRTRAINSLFTRLIGQYPILEVFLRIMNLLR